MVEEVQMSRTAASNLVAQSRRTMENGFDVLTVYFLSKAFHVDGASAAAWNYSYNLHLVIVPICTAFVQ